MINFTDLHRNTAFELRITATDPKTGRSHVYPVFVKVNATPSEAIEALDKVKAHVRKVGLPPAYNQAEDVAGIYRDAARYGTE